MATKANLVIDQGTTYSTTLSLKDENGDILNLNGYYANSQIRKWYSSVSPTATFVTSINTDEGTITLTLNSNTTSNIIAGRYVYDVELTEQSSNAVSRIVEGIVTVTPQATK